MSDRLDAVRRAIRHCYLFDGVNTNDDFITDALVSYLWEHESRPAGDDGQWVCDKVEEAVERLAFAALAAATETEGEE